MKNGRRRMHADEQVIAALRQFFAKHGRAPYVREQRGMAYGVPCKSTLIQRFGSLEKAYRIANVPRNPQGGRAIHRTVRDAIKRHMEIVPIDPVKARALTEDKKRFWSDVEQGKHGLASWVHPYARRSA